MERIDPSRYTRYDPIVDRAAQKHGISQALVKAMIFAECSFLEGEKHQCRDEGWDRSWGPMHVLGSTARGLGFQGDPRQLMADPALGIEYGTRYLARLLAQFGDPLLAVAAYNAGPGRVAELLERYGQGFYDIEAHMPKITRAYVERVFAYRNQFAEYHEQHGLAGTPPRASG